MFTAAMIAMKRICYFLNEARFRFDEGTQHQYSDIDPSLCSHIIINYVSMMGNDLEASMYGDEDEASGKGT